MEKYGQTNESIINNLRNEEAQLMCQVQRIMSSSDKTAHASELSHLEARLSQVRAAITDHDVKDLVGREL